MKIRSIGCVSLVILSALCMYSCENPDVKAAPKGFSYERFRDSLNRYRDTSGRDSTIKDTANIFDSRVFTPGKDSLNTLLTRIDTLWHRDARMMEQMDSLIKRLKKVERNYSEEDKQMVTENIRVLDSFLTAQKRMDTTHSRPACREADCRVFARVNKKQQKLFLYIDGELKDSFLVSTGMKNYTTPAMSTRPQGPILAKYTSKKFPGGNYKGLGNMPYAVFVRSGYAIHGTTPGNFVKLGRIASHGCIRLHPDNARVFYELVKLFGLSNVWVKVE